MLCLTLLAGLQVSSVQQQEPGRLWQEGQRGELQQRSEAIETQQPGPPLLCAQ